MQSDLNQFTGGAPALRVQAVNDREVRADGQFVLYWMIAARRSTWNVALDRAVAWARELERPLVVVESLRVDAPYASARMHRFVLDGMVDNQAAFDASPVLYHPYIEPRPGVSADFIPALSADACVVVTDDFPAFFLPAAVRRVAARVPVRMEAVDGNGVLPLRAADRAFTAAVHYRRHMQRVLKEHLPMAPAAEPLKGLQLPRLSALPPDILQKWPAVAPDLLTGTPGALAALPIDHVVAPVSWRGGSRAARAALRRFIESRLDSYHLGHNHPDEAGTSRLSPYLHFGHLSAVEVLDAVLRHCRWTMGHLPNKATGSRAGWWDVGEGPEAFLDQLVTWRELAFNTCTFRPDDYDRFAGLPAWAVETLQAHAGDARPFCYSRAQFESGETHDPLWNAAQREMREDGWMHNYMRMLWGKKILEWSASPEEALDTMVALMNRWCVDGRDPNSYAGYMWTLGRYDHPWQERAIYGTVRSMSSVNTAKKVHVARYLSGTHPRMGTRVAASAALSGLPFDA